MQDNKGPVGYAGPPQQYPPPPGYGPPQGQAYPPQGQAYPPPPAYAYPMAQPQPQSFTQQQQSTNVVVVSQPGIRTGGGGNCPHCQTGMLMESYSLLGIILLILFFPIGIICCLMMTERKCTHCGYRY